MIFARWVLRSGCSYIGRTQYETSREETMDLYALLSVQKFHCIMYPGLCQATVHKAGRLS